MRILHVYKDYYPVLGGIENHVRVLAEGQAAAGHDVTVLVTNTAPVTRVEMLDGVRVIKAGRLAHVASTPLSLGLPWQLARLKPQITHLHFPYPVGEVAQYLLGRGEHTVLSYHSDVVRQQAILRFYRPLMRRVLRSIDRILVATPNYLTSSEVLQPFRNKCCIVPYGIDRRRFMEVDLAAAQAVRARYAPDGPLLLFVGVLRYYKGLQYLLEAMPDIPARLLIAGDGPMAPALREQVRALGLGSRVILAGRVPDEELPAYYHAADLFVLPSGERSEAFGLVLVEAMSAGLPVVSTELGTGTSYVNKQGESGVVVPAQNPQALAQAINALLADEPLRQRLAAGALARSALFDREPMLAQIEQVYAKLVAGKSRG
ncbi:MAG: glycosyltransferase [Chloroflexi bacterium]|jgi:glycosyltransferase involved in cell wall biosynthesis|nr:glycosyltransferase [Chloroflexota bacterium]